MSATKRIGVLGSGTVGQVLADGFLKHGHTVKRGSREPAKLAGWATQFGDRASAGTFAETAAWADLVVLAVKGSAAESVLDLAGADSLAGKVVIDTTNPIADAPPDHGVIRYFTEANESLMERLQKKVPAARFVKAFSCVGNAFMVNPSFEGGPPTMFICGDDPAAKADVTEILGTFGWDVADMGTVHGARAIEPLCQLWCIPGMSGGGWHHAFKLLR
jgi:predicted dinucleotide-binding enzyme